VCVCVCVCVCVYIYFGGVLLSVHVFYNIVSSLKLVT